MPRRWRSAAIDRTRSTLRRMPTPKRIPRCKVMAVAIRDQVGPDSLKPAPLRTDLNGTDRHHGQNAKLTKRLILSFCDTAHSRIFGFVVKTWARSRGTKTVENKSIADFQPSRLTDWDNRREIQAGATKKQVPLVTSVTRIGIESSPRPSRPNGSRSQGARDHRCNDQSAT